MRSDSGVSSGASGSEPGTPARSERRRGGELVPEETAPKSR